MITDTAEQNRIVRMLRREEARRGYARPVESPGGLTCGGDRDYIGEKRFTRLEVYLGTSSPEDRDFLTA